MKIIEEARTIEYFWLIKYMYSTSINIFAFWLTPLLACVAIFSTCVYLGVPLALGMAFTAITIVHTMQEPMRIFLQALIVTSQVLLLP